jgi:hypothetical protein
VIANHRPLLAEAEIALVGLKRVHDHQEMEIEHLQTRVVEPRGLARIATSRPALRMTRSHASTMKEFELTETILDSFRKVLGRKGLETSLLVGLATEALGLRETQRAPSIGHLAPHVMETGAHLDPSTGAHAPHVMETGTHPAPSREAHVPHAMETRTYPGLSTGAPVLCAMEIEALPALSTGALGQPATATEHHPAHLTGMPDHLETDTGTLLTEMLALHVMAIDPLQVRSTGTLAQHATETETLSTKSLSKATVFSMTMCQ